MTICLALHVTIYVSRAHVAFVIGRSSPRAISQEASGDRATICLPSRLSRVRAPSPALTSTIIPLKSPSQADSQAYTIRNCINNVVEMRTFDLLFRPGWFHNDVLPICVTKEQV